MTHGCKAMNHTIFLRPTKCSQSAIINFFNTMNWNVWKISDLVVMCGAHVSCDKKKYMGRNDKIEQIHNIIHFSKVQH